MFQETGARCLLFIVMKKELYDKSIPYINIKLFLAYNKTGKSLNELMFQVEALHEKFSSAHLSSFACSNQRGRNVRPLIYVIITFLCSFLWFI